MNLLRKILSAVGFVLGLTACGAAPSRVDDVGAIQAAKQLVASNRSWAAQATYVAQGKGAERVVVVSCNWCREPDGSAVSAELVVLVSRDGIASFLVGIE